MWVMGIIFGFFTRRGDWGDGDGCRGGGCRLRGRSCRTRLYVFELVEGTVWLIVWGGRYT